VSGTRYRLLFVDDEQRILEGIARMLRPQRAELEVFTATSGSEALQLLAGEAIDVVISDMRMPLMDGAQLLGEIRQRHPGMVRIILSGQSDRDTIVRATGVAHQFLSKPCDADELRGTIERCRRLDRLLPDAGLRARLAGLEGLPSLPGTLERLAAGIDAGGKSEWIGAEVEADPGLASKVIQVSATSFFGTPRSFLTPAEAARRLGSEVVRAMISAARLPGPGPEDFNWSSWARHSCRVAALARSFAAALDPALIGQAATAGLLHACGRAGIASIQAVDGTVLAPWTEPHLVALGPTSPTHADYGAYLLALWGLPWSIVEAVARHHAPGAWRGPGDRLLAVLHAATGLALAPSGATLDADFLEAAGLIDRLPAWQAQAAGSAA